MWWPFAPRSSLATALLAPAANDDVLRIGTYNGIPGQYTSIRTAVERAMLQTGAAVRAGYSGSRSNAIPAISTSSPGSNPSASSARITPIPRSLRSR